MTDKKLFGILPYDPATNAVTGYAYAPGEAPVAGETYEGVTAFHARRFPISDLAKASSDIYDPLFAGAALVPVDVAFGWDPAATGGNELARVRVAAPGVDRTLLLASGTAPSHFTVIVDYTPAPPAPTP
jgi:hypothetical protein